ncbi:MAG: 5'-nucleotidase C-terminal domain-containing protein, partial [Pseudomonadota bacterium]
MFTLQILHTSDLEGGVDAIANAPNFATVVDALEQEAAALDVASITLSSGDNYIPGPFYNAGSDFGIAVTYEGFYNEFFGLVDRAPLDALAESADTNGDGFFDNGEIQAQIDAGTVTFEEIYTVDVNGDGAADYFEELDTFGGRVDIAIANAIGFDASAVGNHEFDASTAGFFSTINYESEEGNSLSGGRYGNVNFLQEVDNVGAQFPYLSANLDFSGDPSDLAEIVTTDGLLTADSFASDLSGARVDPTDPTLTGPDGRDAKIAPSTIIEVEDPATMTVERVGVVGATTQLIAELTSNGGVVDTSGGVEDMAALAAVLQPFVDALTAEGVDKIVLVSHLQQFSLEQELASLLTGVDVILAGGSDTISADTDDRLRTGDTADQPYPAFVTNAGGSQTAILSTDGEYSYVGRLVIEFDDAGNIIPGSIDPAVSGAFATDDQGVLDVTGAATVEEAIAASESGTQVKNLADTVSGIVAEIDGDIAGESAVFLNGIRDDVRTQETNFGNLTADANLLAAQTVEPTVTVSIKNGGGIRSQIGEITGEGERTITEANELSGKEAGEVSELDIDNTLRFDNDLVIVDLSTEDLKIILEHGVAASEPGDT